MVAEGWEDAKTLELLTSFGCDLVQGDSLGRPQPAGELEFPSTQPRPLNVRELSGGRAHRLEGPRASPRALVLLHRLDGFVWEPTSAEVGPDLVWARHESDDEGRCNRMTRISSPKGESGLRKSDDWREATLSRALRTLIKQADPEVVEERKWAKASNPEGVPTWYHDGIICTGETYKTRVKLTFAKGGLPEGSLAPVQLQSRRQSTSAPLIFKRETRSMQRRSKL